MLRKRGKPSSLFSRCPVPLLLLPLMASPAFSVWPLLEAMVALDVEEQRSVKWVEVILPIVLINDNSTKTGNAIINASKSLEAGGWRKKSMQIY